MYDYYIVPIYYTISTKQVNSNLINTIWNFDICKISEIETSIDLNQKNSNYKILIIWCLNTYLKKENLKSIQVKNILHDIYSWHPIVPVLCKYLFPLNSIQAILKQSRLQCRFLRALCIYIYIFTPACDTLLRLSLPVSINGGPFPFSLPGWHSAK